MMIKNASLAVLALLLMNIPAKAEDAVASSADIAPYVEAAAPALDQADVVIKDQLEAIRKRNDRIAYELNSKGIQEEFHDPQAYMRMIRREKPSLYEHVSYEILGAKTPNSKFHKVRLTDKYGHNAMAMFKMEKNDLGDWKIKDIIVLQYDNDPI